MIADLLPLMKLKALKLQILLNVDILISIYKFKFDWFS